MKKLLFFLMITIFSVVLNIPVYASEYLIDELGLSVSLSNGYGVLTRNETKDVDSFNRLGINVDDAIQNMKDNNIYLDAINSEDLSEITITGTYNLIYDFSLLSEDNLRATTELLIPAMENSGVKDIKADINNYDNENYIILDYWQNNGDQKVYSQQYYTVYNNRAINIRLDCYRSDIVQTAKAELLAAVKNIKYQSAHPQRAEESVYSDESVSFTLPSGWKEGKLSKQRKCYDALIDSSKQAGMIVLYGCTDIFNEYKMAGFHQRNNVNTETITDEIINSVFQEILGEDVRIEYERIRIREQEYLKIKTASLSYDDINIKDYVNNLSLTDKVSGTHIFYVDNGYLYLYSLLGVESDIYEQDLMQMVRSAIYKEQKSNEFHESLMAILNNTLVYIVTSIILSFLLSCLPIIIYRYKIKKKPVSYIKALFVMLAFTMIKAFIMVTISVLFRFDLISGKVNVVPLAWFIIDLLILSKGYNKDNTNFESLESSDDFEKSDFKNFKRNNTNQILYCRNCGKKSNELSAFCNSCGFHMINQNSILGYCRKCGKELPLDSKYCQYCGEKVVLLDQGQKE